LAQACFVLKLSTIISTFCNVAVARVLFAMGNVQDLVTAGSCREEGFAVCTCSEEIGSPVTKVVELDVASVLESAAKGPQKERRPLHTFSDGASYLGQWLGGLRHGYGLHIWPDGTKYEGQWENDNAAGQGRLEHIEDGVYDGQWRNSKAHGHGTYNYSNGTKYIGQWEDDKQHGDGLQSWPDGNRYEGQYRGGRKNGKGHFNWASGATFEGEFADNNFDGFGIYQWEDGRTYEGQWCSNQMHGKGIFTWSNGRSYMGEYQYDQKQGYGWFKWPDGSQYEGEWKDGKQHGIGTYLAATGEKTEGEWAAGRRLTAEGNDEPSKVVTSLTGVQAPIQIENLTLAPPLAQTAPDGSGEGSRLQASIPEDLRQRLEDNAKILPVSGLRSAGACNDATLQPDPASRNAAQTGNGDPAESGSCIPPPTARSMATVEDEAVPIPVNGISRRDIAMGHGAFDPAMPPRESCMTMGHGAFEPMIA